MLAPTMVYAYHGHVSTQIVTVIDILEFPIRDLSGQYS